MIEVTVWWSSEPAIYFFYEDYQAIVPASFEDPTQENLEKMQKHNESWAPELFALQEPPAVGTVLGDKFLVKEVKHMKKKSVS